ncbi:MAG: hypothetical protein U0905_06850 [Pirellulales bacterium]
MGSGNIPRQPLSVYSVMLIISMLLMLAACILLSIEAAWYGSPWEPTGIPNAMNVGPGVKTSLETFRAG